MPLTPEDIYTYAKDSEELNILLEGELQSSEPLITLAMKMAVDDFNIQAPVTTFRVGDFPSSAILLYGTLHHLANSEAERQLRNQVNYSAQGLNAGIDDKHQVYNQLAIHYKQLFESKMQAFKQYLNQEDAWGHIDSPYRNLNHYKFRSN